MKDTEVRKLTQKERARQKRVVNLIASENYTSRDVREALASEFTNKYAEGYPGARYYGGNEVVDELERLTQARALKLFKLSPDEWHVNVQPLSGSPANLAVYYALMAPFGKIMGLELSHGGHLTHGHKVSATGRLWTPVPYTLDPKSELLNYSAIKKIARKEKPDILVAGYTAYPRIIDWKKMRGAANAGGALLMADISHIAGLIAGSVYPSPFPYVSVVTTTMHKTLRGPRAALIFTRKDGTDFYKRIDKAIFPGLQGGPHMNTIAGVAVALREANTPNFKKYSRQVVKNARTLAN
ncbi:MAG: Serine hydroxymethyltransferase, partial [Parcubacteria group bacterium GW2011_GWF1_52_5]